MRRSHHSFRRPVGLTVAAVLALGALAGCGETTSSEEVVPADGPVSGEESFVQLPHGRIAFTVGQPAPVPESATHHDDASSGDHLGVSWVWQPGAGVNPELAGFALPEKDPGADVVLRVGDDEHDLGAAYPVPGEQVDDAVYVPVDGDPALSEVTIEVTFDGASQTVAADGTNRAAGRAGALYTTPASPKEADCDVALSAGATASGARCEVASLQLPWVRGIGWAEEGTTWTVVDLTTEVAGFSVGKGRYRVTGITAADKLDDRAPATVLFEEAARGGTSLRLQAAYPSASDDGRVITIARTLEHDHDEGPDPLGDRKVTVTGTVDLGR